MKIGWAFTDLTPSRPVYLAGQHFVRVSRYIHDPITASALAMEQRGEQAVFVSMDTVAVPDYLMDEIRSRFSKIEGPDPSKICICATHTHTSSRFGPVGNELFVKYIGSERMEEIPTAKELLAGQEARNYLCDKVEQLILDAWNNRETGYVAAEEDYAVVGFNRRPVFQTAEGDRARMYGDCSDASFLRMEGGADHSIHMLYTWNEEKKLTGIAVEIPCPAQVMELHSFLSADYWDAVRNRIREIFGDVFLLPLCGPAGDQNPLDLVQISKWNREELCIWRNQAEEVWRNLDMTRICQGIGDRVADAVKRGYQNARNHMQKDPIFLHKILNEPLPLRMVSKADYEEAAKRIQDSRRLYSKEKKMSVQDQIKLYRSIGVAERYHLQQQTSHHMAELHMIRIADTAVITTPFELFVEYGLRIRGGCPARHVIQIQLCNGYSDYLPTRAAIYGGSYSSEPASTYVGPDGGDQLVSVIRNEAAALF